MATSTRTKLGRFVCIAHTARKEMISSSDISYLRPGALHSGWRSCCPLALWICLVVLCVSACSTATAPAPAITPLPAVNQEAARKSLRDTEASFAKQLEKKGPAEALYEFLGPDGTVLLPGEFPIKGRDAVRVHFSALPAALWNFKPLGTEVSR